MISSCSPGRQVRQNGHRALADAEHDAAADIAGERADRQRSGRAVDADRIEAAANQQEYGFTERPRQTQQAGAAELAQIHRIAGMRRQHEQVEAEPIDLSVSIAFDHSFGHQARKQAMRGGPGKRDGVREILQPQAAPCRGRQAPQESNGTMNASRSIAHVPTYRSFARTIGE